MHVMSIITFSFNTKSEGAGKLLFHEQEVSIILLSQVPIYKSSGKEIVINDQPI